MIEISTDKSKLQIEVIHGFLSTAYWAKGRTLQEVKELSNIACALVYIWMKSKLDLQG